MMNMIKLQAIYLYVTNSDYFPLIVAAILTDAHFLYKTLTRVIFVIFSISVSFLEFSVLSSYHQPSMI